MPEASQPGARAHTSLRSNGQRGVALRVAVGVIFVLSVLAVPMAASPTPVAAGSSCTGWTSISQPPRTIRVLNSRIGEVQSVPFRTYVARVMASGEWPAHFRSATLEAGALVTKQFAWYHAMKGHHRPYYFSGGKCYDVRDTTDDQLYKHYARPSLKQWRAVSKTWDLTLRKYGKFFLTGYRAGINGSCAADANGWKLYASSVEACASQGWSFTRILRKYLSPNLQFVWSKSGPMLSKPKLELAVGSSIDAGAAKVTWHPLPRKAGVARFTLQRKVAKGGWKNVSLPKAKAWTTNAWVKIGANNRFRIRAQDGQGNWGPWSYGLSRRAEVRGPAGTILAGTRTARGTRTAAAKSAVPKPRKARARFRGRSVALVARTGPGMGKVRVSVDGKAVATVDLERARLGSKRLVWARNWARIGKHSIAVRPLNGRERVDFNGFLVLR